MTAATLNRMNVALVLPVPVAAVMYLALGDAKTLGPFTIAALVALGVVWLTVAAAVNTIPRPELGLLEGATGVAEGRRLRRVVPGAWAAKDVSRPHIPWGWSILLAPLELLVLAWAVPAVILLVMVPIGLAVAGVLWVGRLLFQS